MNKSNEHTNRELSATCALCLRPLYKSELTNGTHIPANWDIILQAHVCPDCIKRAKEDNLNIANTRIGYYASDLIEWEWVGKQHA